MRALVIGASGLVGGALLRQLGPDSVGTFRERPRPGLRPLDAADDRAVAALVREVQPEAVFFPAGNPNVDWCEREPERAERENLLPVRTVLGLTDVPLIAYSTDYVFDGASGPYGEADPLRPLSVYGRLKAELERAVLARGGTIIRPTGVFGWEPEPPKNFVLRLVASLRRGERARVPSDQLANPTYAEDLAVASVRIAHSDERGIWHVAGREHLARDAFAREVARSFDLDPELIDGVPTEALGQLAPRPLRGGLRCDRYAARFGDPPVRPVKEALALLRRAVEAQ